MNEVNIDSRIAAAFGKIEKKPEPRLKSREELLAWAYSDETVAIREVDGNTIHIQFIRPESAEPLPCVYYIHGGGMKELSCYDGNYRAWGRLLARQGVAVAMIDFRNALLPSSVPEVAPFPAGLNDCVSGIKWVSANSETLGIDRARIIVSGESGGGTLTLAAGLKLKQDGDLGLIRGLYALCPGIGNIDSTEEESFSNGNDSGKPEKTYSSGILAYGIAEYENRNPLAWPGFAAGGDVRGLPPTMISVNEFDRNEGSIKFYRLLLSQGVPASCRQLMGTSHAVEVFPSVCPDISSETARSIADFCRGLTRPGGSG